MYLKFFSLTPNNFFCRTETSIEIVEEKDYVNKIKNEKLSYFQSKKAVH